MKTVNRVILMGYVTSEPIERLFDNGTKCVNMTLKTRDFYGPSNDRKVDKNFHNLIFWNGIGEMVTTILGKGDLVYIEGHLKTKKIEKPGKGTVYKVEIVVDEWTKVAEADTTEEKD